MPPPDRPVGRASAAGELLAGLADLVLPSACAGCGAERVPLRLGTCADCVVALEVLTPYPAVPVPPPRGMPPCTAVGPYAGPLRGVLLAYKEKGRHRLARPLGALLAGAVAAAAVRAGAATGTPLLLVPVPSTAAAARRRHGDHLARLAGHAVRRLRAAGWHAELARPLRAAPRPDSADLDAAARAAVAESSLRIKGTRIGISQRRSTMRGTLVVVDDIVTTGATLAAVATRLTEANMQVAGAAVLAATQLRRADRGSGRSSHRPVVIRAQSPEALPRTRGDWGASAR
ncbi:ComF family protein [Krasilnikovia sp. MM14-A1004]|uniref:ComF family protein n=1 Tax=Krasilnikovia sp. MM14-A1004 TaxID=3373541 RepID=UPI00399C5E23